MSLFSSGKQRRGKQIAANYYPKSIGLSLPGNSFDYEFLICGKNVPYTQNQIVNQFIGHGAMLISLDSSADPLENRFILSICCNLEHADTGPTELAVQLQEMKFVTSAEYCEIRGRLFGRRLAGISFNSRDAAVALRAGSMISLGRRLARESGSIGTAVLYEEGRAYAHEIMEDLWEILQQGPETGFADDQKLDVPPEKPEEAYCMRCRAMRRIQSPRQVLFSNKTHALQGECIICSTKVFKIGSKIYGKIRTSPLIENTQALLMATGWGTFELFGAIEGRSGEVLISSPPTLDEDIQFGNQFVEGIAAGLLEAASGTRNRMVVVGEKYDQSTRNLRLHFAEEIPVRKRAKVRALNVQRSGTISDGSSRSITPEDELDKIIGALEKIESGVTSFDSEPIEAKKDTGESEQQIII